MQHILVQAQRASRRLMRGEAFSRVTEILTAVVEVTVHLRRLYAGEYLFISTLVSKHVKVLFSRNKGRVDMVLGMRNSACSSYLVAIDQRKLIGPEQIGLVIYLPLDLK